MQLLIIGIFYKYFFILYIFVFRKPKYAECPSTQLRSY